MRNRGAALLAGRLPHPTTKGTKKKKKKKKGERMTNGDGGVEKGGE